MRRGVALLAEVANDLRRALAVGAHFERANDVRAVILDHLSA